MTQAKAIFEDTDTLTCNIGAFAMKSLGQVHLSRNDSDLAWEAFKKAKWISEALYNEKGVREAEDLINECGRMSDVSCGSPRDISGLEAKADFLTIATWNIAAMDTNPFEFWMTHSEKYDSLMQGLEQLLDCPGGEDLPMNAVFSETMFQELKGLMHREGWDGLETLDTMWREDYSKRRILSDFLKDKMLGEQRLLSTPDLVTSRIHRAGHGRFPAQRPSVVNHFAGNLLTLEGWLKLAPWLFLWWLLRPD